jgi:thioredoxin reductase (NADPH)
MSHYLIARLEYTPNVRIHTESTVSALRGGEQIASATISHAEGAEEDVPVCGLFVLIGADPCTAWLGDLIALDEHNFVLTGPEAAASASSPFQTSQPGIFAVGDVRSGSVKRVASAVGEGSVVVQAVHRYLAEVGAGAQLQRERLHAERLAATV